MPEAESLSSMLQNSFSKVSDGNYRLKTESTPAIPTIQQSTSTTDTTTNPITSPSAGATIASTASLAAGTWEVEVHSFITGTTATSDSTNMRLTLGATPITRILNPVVGTSGANGLGRTKVRVQVASASSISVITVSAGTTGSIYSANIVATRIA